MKANEIVGLLTAITPLVQQTAILLNTLLAGLAFWQAKHNAKKVTQIQHQTDTVVKAATESAYREGKAHGAHECQETEQLERVRQNSAMKDAGETMARLGD